MRENIIVDVKEICITTKNWIDSVRDMDCWENPCECDIELSGFVSQGVNYF